MDFTNAARQARWRAKRKAELARLRQAAGGAAEIAALKQELKLAKAHIAQLEKAGAKTRRRKTA